MFREPLQVLDLLVEQMSAPGCLLCGSGFVFCVHLGPGPGLGLVKCLQLWRSRKYLPRYYPVLLELSKTWERAAHFYCGYCEPRYPLS